MSKGNFKVKRIKGYRNFTTVGKIYDVVDGVFTYDDGNREGIEYYSVDEMNANFVSQFELANEAQSIHIYRHDNEVIATLKTGKQTTKTAKAKCNPADEFKFEIGAKLAFHRLIGKEEKTVREVHRPAKIGEWIKATSNGTWHGNKYSVGDTYLVDDNYYTGNAYYHINKSDEIMLSIDNYVVLENYHPEDKPKTLADYTIKELVTELSRRYE